MLCRRVLIKYDFICLQISDSITLYFRILIDIRIVFAKVIIVALRSDLRGIIPCQGFLRPQDQLRD